MSTGKEAELLNSQELAVSKILSHTQAVDYLYSRLESLAVVSPSGRRIVLLRGASGTGKSWIIRELYNKLRKERGDKYWPELGKVAISSRNPLSERKIIGPELRNHVWSKNTLPTFSWWTVNCEQLNSGALQDVRASLRDQFEAHAAQLELAHKKDPSYEAKMARLKSATKQGAERALKDSGRLLIDWGLSAVGPFGAFIPTIYDYVSKQVQASYTSKKNYSTDLHLGQKVDQTALEQLIAWAEMLRVTCSPRLPAVVAVEDIHRMDLTLELFLDEIAAPTIKSEQNSVLVVGTEWPEAAIQRDSAYARWRDDAIAAGRLEVIEVLPLDQTQLASIVLEYAPNTDPDVAGAVVQGALSNPYILKLWLTQKRVSKEIAENNQALPTDVGKSLPRTAEEVWNERWEELSEDVQDALMKAVGANPIEGQTLCEFLPTVISGISWAESTVTTGQEALLRAVEAQWTQAEEDVHFLKEEQLAEVVEEAVFENYREADIDNLQMQTLPLLLSVLTDSTNTAEERINWTSRLRIAAAWYLSIVEHQRPSESPSEQTHLPATVSWILANFLAQQGRYSDAIGYFAENRTDLFESWGDDSLAALGACRSYANWLAFAGNLQEAENEHVRIDKILKVKHQEITEKWARYSYLHGEEIDFTMMPSAMDFWWQPNLDTLETQRDHLAHKARMKEKLRDLENDPALSAAQLERAKSSVLIDDLRAERKFSTDNWGCISAEDAAELRSQVIEPLIKRGVRSDDVLLAKARLLIIERLGAEVMSKTYSITQIIEGFGFDTIPHTVPESWECEAESIEVQLREQGFTVDGSEACPHCQMEDLLGMTEQLQQEVAELQPLLTDYLRSGSDEELDSWHLSSIKEVIKELAIGEQLLGELRLQRQEN